MVEFCHSMGKRHVSKKQGLQHMRREVEVRTLRLGNDKNNVIADKVLSCFQCLSSMFEVYVARFGIK